MSSGRIIVPVPQRHLAEEDAIATTQTQTKTKTSSTDANSTSNADSTQSTQSDDLVTQQLTPTKQLIFLPTSTGTLPSLTAPSETLSFQQSGQIDILYVEEFVVLTEDCQELVSTDEYSPIFDLAGNGAEGEVRGEDEYGRAALDCSVTQVNDEDTGMQNALATTDGFVGCYYPGSGSGSGSTGNGSNAGMESPTTVVRGTVNFQYDLYVRQDGMENYEESMKQLESSMLRVLSEELSFECRQQNTGVDEEEEGKEEEKDAATNGGKVDDSDGSDTNSSGNSDNDGSQPTHDNHNVHFLGISSRPRDVIDDQFPACTSTSTLVADNPTIDGVEVGCVPINGAMTYYVADEQAAKAAERTVRNAVRQGADDGSFLSSPTNTGTASTSPDLLDVVFVEDRLKAAIPPTIANETKIIVEEIRSSVQGGGIAAGAPAATAGNYGGISGISITGIAMAGSASLLIAGITGYRRKVRSRSQMDEEDEDAMSVEDLEV